MTVLPPDFQVYPEDFTDLIKPSDQFLDGYRHFLNKYGGKRVTDIFLIAQRLIVEENAPEDLERIRIGLIHLKMELQSIMEHDSYEIL